MALQPTTIRTGPQGFLTILGVLDFDVDAIGPNCVAHHWGWSQDLYLQLLLPLLVWAINHGQYRLAQLLLRMRFPQFRVLRWLRLAPSDDDELSELYDNLNLKIVSFVNMVYVPVG